MSKIFLVAKEAHTLGFETGKSHLLPRLDLQAAFGANTEAATIHYITAGYFEVRTDHPLA